MGGSAATRVIGRYAIHGKIAQGGMAAVHFGRLQGAAGFARTVAVKRLHAHLAEEPEFLATMIDEARLAARIHHLNVVPTLDVVSEAGELLVVMEYVRGEVLSRLMRGEEQRKRRIPLPIASAVALGALHGLHAAHEATSDRGTPLGIVHRDVSPQNVLVGVDGVPRIIDFGVAKAAGRLQTTSQGVVKGKIAYMAPEQLSAAETTRSADIYAMGVVLWEMLTGLRLFDGETDTVLIMKVLSGSAKPPSTHAPNLPPELDTLVMRALSRDPAGRFATTLEMADALVRIVPPALPRDVGLWVEELARETLDRRAATLAEIESSSGVSTVPPPSSAARAVDDDAPTIASQPSSLSVETSKPRGARLSSGARFVGAVVAGFGAALLVGFAAIAWHGARPSSEGEKAVASPGLPASETPPAPSPSPSASEDVPPPAASSAPAATVASTSSSAPAPPSVPARHGSRAPTAAPQPSHMVRFAQPD